MHDSTENIDTMINSLTDEDKATLFSQVPSGLSALMQIVAAVDGTPLEGWLNERVVEIALALIGKMAALNQFGGSMKFDELESVVDSYHGAMSGVPEHSRMTGTINAAADELGSVADKYIKRHLITALDTSKVWTTRAKTMRKQLAKLLSDEGIDWRDYADDPLSAALELGLITDADIAELDYPELDFSEPACLARLEQELDEHE